MSNLRHCDKCDKAYLAEIGHQCPMEPATALNTILIGQAETISARSDMNNNAIAGVHPDTLVVEIVASMEPPFAGENIAEIREQGFLPIVTTKDIAREKWGTKLNSVFDLLSA